VAVLSAAGFPSEEPDDLQQWVVDRQNLAGALVTLSTPEDREALSKLRTVRPDCVLVALLQDSGPTGYLEALRAGASAAVPWEAEPELIVKVLRVALEGYSLLPLPVTEALMTASPPASREVPPMTSQDVKRLQLLADGVTVVELARQVGYSEREMFRLLHDLYHRMGVDNRSEALVKAAQWGLLQQ
jgi:two-component system, NarL family, response regulator DesR